jgi:hypothetical protein
VAAEEVNSIATRRFWDLFNALSPEIQKLAAKNYELWLRDPHHRSLHFRRLQGSKDRFSVRVGDRNRAIGRLTDETMTRVWIGTHSEYGRIVDS